MINARCWISHANKQYCSGMYVLYVRVYVTYYNELAPIVTPPANISLLAYLQTAFFTPLATDDCGREIWMPRIHTYSLVEFSMLPKLKSLMLSIVGRGMGLSESGIIALAPAYAGSILSVDYHILQWRTKFSQLDQYIALSFLDWCTLQVAHPPEYFNRRIINITKLRKFVNSPVCWVSQSLWRKRFFIYHTKSWERALSQDL